jgi:hypothetical protein
MFTLYLACLIFGGILLGASLFSMGDSHADAGNSDGLGDAGNGIADSDISDIHTELIQTGHDVSTESEHYLQISKTSHAKDVSQFLSFRNIIFFTSFFGLTGTLFTFFEVGEILTLISSLTIGGLSWFTGFAFMKYLKNTESGEELKMTELIGKSGVIEIPITKDKKGKIIVNVGSYSREYPAMLSEASKLEKIDRSQKVLVIDVSDGNLIIDYIED